MTAVTLKSHDGHEELAIEFTGPVEHAREAGHETVVRIHGLHRNAERSFPVHLSAAGLWLRGHDLASMQVLLDAWVKLPMERLLADDLTGNFRLARVTGQTFNLRFGPRPDTISGVNPVVSLTLKAGVLDCDYHFVTDQAQVGAFAAALAGCLREAPVTSPT